MSDSPTTPAPSDHLRDEPLRYPSNTVIGVLDTQDQLERVVAALTGGGFLPAEVHVTTGPRAADALHAATGRSGLANIALRIAERIGIQDDEQEFKAHYEQAMRDGRFVVTVEAPTEPRRERATELLREGGAHSVSYFGRFSIEGIVPPREGAGRRA